MVRAAGVENGVCLLAELGLFADSIFAFVNENPQHVLDPVQPFSIGCPCCLEIPQLQKQGVNSCGLGGELGFASRGLGSELGFHSCLNIGELLVGSGEGIDEQGDKQRRNQAVVEPVVEFVAFPPGDRLFGCVHQG